MKKLFLFARNFPYGNNETYLETEILHYENFDEVYIFSLSVLPNQKLRDIYIPPNIKVYRVPFSPKSRYILSGLKNLITRVFYREVMIMVKKNKFKVTNIIDLLIFLARFSIDYNYIENIIEDEKLINNNDEVYLYSYRFDYSALIAAKLFETRNNVYRLTRAHGIDLYEFRKKSDYLPLREYILERLDRCYLISKEGLNYALKEYPNYSSKFKVSYLGTSEITISKENLSDTMQLVSCSNVINIKRVHLIFEALQRLDFDIVWTHYGTGENFLHLENIIKESRDGLTVKLLGQVENKQILNDYQRIQYDLFINVSLTEGLPVSIMEAFSAGIPAIGTNVGGTSEIINNGVNGFLIPKNFNIEELVKKIKIYNNLDNNMKRNYRDQALNTWQTNFNSNNNYKVFSKSILDLKK